MGWNNYYKVHEKSNTSKLLIEAEKYINQKKGEALDIGTGTGRDIPFLLSKNFNVTAIDKEKKSIEIIKEKFKSDSIHTIQTNIEDFSFEIDTYDFINAQFTLFFIEQNKILGTLEKVKESLKPSGVFCGQILGIDDEWANMSHINYLKEEELKSIFSEFKMPHFKEIKKQGMTATGKEKFWHYYNFIIVK